MSILPKGWIETTLEDACEKISDGTHHSPKEQYDKPAKGLYKYITAKNIRMSGLDLGNLTYVTEKVHREIYKRCNPEYGDVLLTKDGVNAGDVAINTLDEEFSLLSSVALLKPKRALLEPKFLRYYIESPEGTKRLLGEMRGAAIRRIILRSINAASIPIAPLPEQRRIVARIEELFSRLDAGVAALRHAKAQLQRYRQSVLAAAVTGQLTQAWREQHPETEPASEAVAAMLKERKEKWERRGKYMKPALPPGDLEPLPENWCWATWDQLSHWVTYGFTRPMEHVEEGIPIVTAKHVKDSRINYEDGHRTPQGPYEALSEKDRPKPGDILVTKDGTIGRAAVVESDRAFCINQSVAVVWLRTCPMYRKYLLTTIETESAQRLMTGKARGVAIKHLSITDFAKMSVPIPPLAEQHQIVAEVEARTTAIDHLEAELDRQITRSNRLRQSTLAAAFSGNF
jgi:type I restriction enzyme S subunit